MRSHEEIEREIVELRNLNRRNSEINQTLQKEIKSKDDKIFALETLQYCLIQTVKLLRKEEK